MSRPRGEEAIGDVRWALEPTTLRGLHPRRQRGAPRSREIRQIERYVTTP